MGRYTYIVALMACLGCDEKLVEFKVTRLVPSLVLPDLTWHFTFPEDSPQWHSRDRMCQFVPPKLRPPIDSSSCEPMFCVGRYQARMTCGKWRVDIFDRSVSGGFDVDVRGTYPGIGKPDPETLESPHLYPEVMSGWCLVQFRGKAASMFDETPCARLPYDDVGDK